MQDSDDISSASEVVRDRAATEARILDAARTVFARRGYDAAGLREIAEMAQANLSLISRYFGGKEGLLTALMDQFVRSRREGALPYPPRETLGEEIYSYLCSKLTSDLEDEDLIRLIVSRAAVDERFRRQGSANLDGKADRNFLERVEALQEKGGLPSDIKTDLLFAAVQNLSFSVNFFEVIIGGRSLTESEPLFRYFARMLAGDPPLEEAASVDEPGDNAD